MKKKVINMSSCRICLVHKKLQYPLFDETDAPSYGEMLNNCANVKVFSGDGFPDKICCSCSNTLKSAYKLRKTAEKSDVVLRNNANLLNIDTAEKKKKVKRNLATKKMSFNSITDIKSELDALNKKLKSKPEIGIKILDQSIVSNNAEALNGQDIVICNTVIRKIEATDPDSKKQNEIEDNDFQDDPRDEDYFPPKEEQKPVTAKKLQKPKFAISTLKDVRAFEEKEKIKEIVENKIRQQSSSYMAYCPILENGEKGSAVLLKRPRLTGQKTSRGHYRLLRIQENPATLSREKSVCCPVSPIGPLGPILENGEKGPVVLLKRPKEKGQRKSCGPYCPRIQENPSKRPKPREKNCCPVCGVLTFSIRNHLLTHAETKPFQCEECQQSFVSKICFEVHVKKHKGIKDHVCEICGAAFYSLKNVKRHKLIHKNERPHECTLCNRKFLLRYALRRHQEIHAGYKPFKCTMCAMSFNASHQLRNHMIMHTGERPYSCKICDLKFGYKVNLNNHVTRVHGINLRYKSIYTVTQEVIERETEAMKQAKIQANAFLTIALQTEPQPVPEDHITTQIIFDYEENES